MRRHVSHIAVKTLIQPRQQPRLCVGQIDASQSDLGKAEFMGPAGNAGNQLTLIDASMGVVHPPIVKSLVWSDEAATRLFAASLAQQPAMDHCFVELHGELGAGKTSFVRHLLQAMGVSGRVKSPTYAVVEPYELTRTPTRDAALHIWHFDFYRFNDPDEWEDAGFRDIFASDGLKLAEWPEKAYGMLPLADLAIHITVHDDASRAVRLIAQTPTGATLLAAVCP
jgi:tRNA threonylcarbamoyladenosine biosynthesis protein TsaE